MKSVSNKKLTILFIAISLLAIAFICATIPLFISIRLYPKSYNSIIEHLAKQYKIDKNLVYGVAKTESGFNPKAKSSVGAIGIMQLLPSTAEYIAKQNDIEYDESKLIEPEYNIKLGVLYLCYLQEKFDDISHILLAYNAGEGKVSSWLKEDSTLENFPYEESRNYVERVLKAKKVYEHRDKASY